MTEYEYICININYTKVQESYSSFKSTSLFVTSILQK